MSGTFMDERFRENADRAQLTALKISYAIIFIALIALCQKNFWGNLDFTLIAVIIIISFLGAGNFPERIFAVSL